jgi:hypothetical protein
MAKKPTETPIAADPNAVTFYLITDQAPSHIAGRRIGDDQKTVELTEDQARAELLAGHIAPQGKSASDEA